MWFGYTINILFLEEVSMGDTHTETFDEIRGLLERWAQQGRLGQVGVLLRDVAHNVSVDDAFSSKNCIGHGLRPDWGKRIISNLHSGNVRTLGRLVISWSVRELADLGISEGDVACMQVILAARYGLKIRD
jgi:hypothetical protein